MKNNKVVYLALAGAALVTAGLSNAESIRIKGFRQSKPVTMTLPPVSPDSTVASLNKFDPNSLLSARGILAREQMQDWTTVVPDAEGYAEFPKADKKALLHVVHSKMRPERFAKGKLVLKSSSRADLLFNGKSVAKKSTSDSIPTEVEAPVTLEPEALCDIQINILSLPEDKAAPRFSLEFVPDAGFENVTLYSGDDIKGRFSVNTITLGTRMTNTAMSPDGKYLLCYYTENFTPSNRRSWAELRDAATGKVLNPNLQNTIGWLPTGSTLYYTRSMHDKYDIVTMDPKTMKESVLATNVPESDFEFAPDLSYIIYYKPVEGTKETGIMRRIADPDDRIPGNRDRNYLVKYDLRSGVAQPLTYGGNSTIMLDISPDSKKILYMDSKNEPTRWPFYFANVMEMDANTLECDTIIKSSGYFRGAIYSPDTKKLFVLASPNAFDGIGLNIGNNEMANDFDTQGFIYDRATGKATAVTRDFDPALKDNVVWNSADNMIYFNAEDGFGVIVAQLNPANGKITKLPLPADVVRNYSIGKNEGRYLSATGMGYEYAGRGYLLDLKTGKSTLLADPFAEEMNEIELTKSTDWSFTASDGTVIDGTVTLPPNFDPNKKYPLIVYYYGGTSPSDKTMHHPYTPQIFAARDYVVYVLNPSGTTGYGQEFSARHVNAWGKRTADDIIEGVKEFCKQHPFVDSKKIGCLGASYGGFMTQYLQTQTDIFAAAVSHAGISNVTSYWGEGYWGYTYNSVAAAKSYPWTDPELYTKQGSLFNADKIHTPLLLLHGTVDTNVPIGESIQIFNALRILGRDVEFITVEDANHVVTDYDKRVLWHATIMAWFAKYLQDDPSWWNSLYGNK